jgi:hypothetical protein
MNKPKFTQEELERKIKSLFEQEGAKGDLSPEQWERLLYTAARQKRSRRLSWLPYPASLRRPIVIVSGTLLLAILVSAVSLWQTVVNREVPVGPADSKSFPTTVPGLRGVPAPQRFAVTWKADKTSYFPGESITVSVTFTNVSNGVIELISPSSSVTLHRVDIQDDKGVSIATEAMRLRVEPGQAANVTINVPGNTTTSLEPGRYTVFIKASLVTEGHQIGVGFNSGALFVISP